MKLKASSNVLFRRLFLFTLGISIVVISACGGSADGITSPTSASTITPTATGTGATTYSYTTNVRPILTSDCVRCHNSSQHESGVDLSTYSGVTRVVAAGDPSSVLIAVTQPGGLMYSELSGDRVTKAGIIYDWVVRSGAAQ